MNKILSIVCIYYPHRFSEAVIFWKSLAKYTDVILFINGLDENIDDAVFKDIIRPGKNLGVLAAYNQVINKHKNYEYFWLWDQDTFISSDKISEFIKKSLSHFEDNNTTIVTSYDKKNYKMPFFKNKILVKGSTTLISKKNAFKFSNYLFDENLFVDHGDWDFSLRIYSGGGKIYQLTDIEIEHNLGTPERTIFGYINRPSLDRVLLQGINTSYLIKKYRKINFLILLLLIRTLFIFPFKSLLFKDRKNRIINYYKGIWLGIKGESSKSYVLNKSKGVIKS